MHLQITLLLIATVLLSSCAESDVKSSTQESNTAETDSTSSVVEVEKSPYFLSLEKWDSLSTDTKQYFIVNYAGVETEQAAIEMVDSLVATFPNSGYLWIPDYASLSGKEMFAVFIDQGIYASRLLKKTVQANKKVVKGIYVVGVNQTEERYVAYSPLDIRINGEKQRQILIYAKPEEEQEYGESGGEDWGWYVYEVSQYFSDNHPEIGIENFFSLDLLPEEISSIETKLDIDGFGYVLIDGKEMEFAPHNMSDGVISQASEFFGLEIVEQQ